MTKFGTNQQSRFSTTLWQCHVGCRLGQVFKLCEILEYIARNLKTDFKIQRQTFQDASLPQSC